MDKVWYHPKSKTWDDLYKLLPKVETLSCVKSGTTSNEKLAWLKSGTI